MFSLEQLQAEIISIQGRNARVEKKILGNFMAEKTRNHRNKLLSHGARLLVSRKSWTSNKCDRSDTWLYTLDTLNGVDEENIY